VQKRCESDRTEWLLAILPEMSRAPYNVVRY